MKLTREKVIREIGQLIEDSLSIRERIRKCETHAGKAASSDFDELRVEFDENAKLLEFGKSILGRNEMDFREAEIAVMQIRQSFAAIFKALAQIEMKIDRQNAAN